MLVLTVRLIAQPWRGIIDAGVVIGLVAGTASLLWQFARALLGHPPAVADDLPVRG